MDRELIEKMVEYSKASWKVVIYDSELQKTISRLEDEWRTSMKDRVPTHTINTYLENLKTDMKEGSSEAKALWNEIIAELYKDNITIE